MKKLLLILLISGIYTSCNVENQKNKELNIIIKEELKNTCTDVVFSGNDYSVAIGYIIDINSISKSKNKVSVSIQSCTGMTTDTIETEYSDKLYLDISKARKTCNCLFNSLTRNYFYDYAYKNIPNEYLLKAEKCLN